MKRNLKILFAIYCHKNINNDKLYTWLWIILPDWRYWLIHHRDLYERAYKQKRLSLINQIIWRRVRGIRTAYSEFKWSRLDRVNLWKINNYNSKFTNILSNK